MRRTRLYIAGPMRGIPELNHPAFFEAEAALRPRYITFNPARQDQDSGIDEAAFADNENAIIREVLELDTRWICRHADGIALLNGWRYSKGAKMEVALGKALGLPVRPYRDWITL